MREYLVYLAGPIKGLDYQACTQWRREAARLFPGHIKALSPMRGKDYLAKETQIGCDYPQHVLSTMKAITTRDHDDVRRCDALLVNLLNSERVSIGTMIELGWANAYRKPVVLVMEPKGNLHDHGMVKEIAGFIVPTLEEAVAVLTTILTTEF